MSARRKGCQGTDADTYCQTTNNNNNKHIIIIIMGQILKACTDPSGEAKKSSALTEPNDDVLIKGSAAMDASTAATTTTGTTAASSTSSPYGGTTADALMQQQQQQDEGWRKQMERERALREEQSRLELIISKAGRQMVSVVSTRGTNYYNDQGFAAALAQHLQQTLPPTPIQRELPSVSSSSSTSVYQIMSQPIPMEPTDMDQQAETLLAQKTVVKEQIFAGCPRIVENLL